MSFSVWLSLLSMITSRSMHVAANSSISFFLWLSDIPLYIDVYINIHVYTHIYMYICCVHIYTYHIFFIHSFIYGHLGCIYILAILIVLQWTLGLMYLFGLWFSWASSFFLPWAPKRTPSHCPRLPGKHIDKGIWEIYLAGPAMCHRTAESGWG